MSKADEAFESLKRRIIVGQYAPMADLDEEALCREFKISRTPLREAILRLKAKGYVTVIPNKGTLVRPVSHTLIDEIYAMRTLNEPYICVQSSISMPKEKLLELRSQLTVSSAGESSKEYFIDLDSKLHTEVLLYCGNSFLIEAMQNVYDHNERIRHFASDPQHDHSIEEHLKIIDAMLKGEPAAIEASVLEHVNASKRITENCYKEQPFFNS